MALSRDTVAIPFTSGIQPNNRARMLEPQKLQDAVNCFYELESGPQKRNGHLSRVVRTGRDYTPFSSANPTGAVLRANFSTANPGLLAQNWIYGWGLRGDPTLLSEVVNTADPFEVSAHPNVGLLFGGGTRDNEVLAWDGFRLFSYAPEMLSEKFGEAQTPSPVVGDTPGVPKRTPVCMPAMRTTPMAKIAGSQLKPTGADNGVLRVVTWLNTDGTTVSYSAFDAENLAGVVINSTLTFQAPTHLRLVCTGPWFHILVSDPTANSLEVRSFHQDTPGTVISRSLGTVDQVFDVKKVNESQFIVAKLKGSVITLFFMNVDGSVITSWIPDLGGHAAAANTCISVESDRTGTIGLIWQSGSPADVYFRTYTTGGATLRLAKLITTLTATSGRVTGSPRVTSRDNVSLQPTWDIYVEDTVSSVKQVRSYAVDYINNSFLFATRHRVVLASHAFRAGNRTFVWCTNWLGASGGLQTTWFLCDAAVLPVGKFAYGLANHDLAGTVSTLTGVNWTADPTAAFEDRLVFHGAMACNLRLPTLATATGAAAAQPSGVFTEPSVQFYELDFLPALRSAQVGRSTYFAGAQLWTYDGAEVVEAGFHQAPEGTTGVAAAGGSLTAGDYRYRIDLCHKNAQNEEIRSWSLITPKITATGSQKITLTIPQVSMTRRDDAYFLIFRTEANGTVFYLANSRDPSSANFLKNDPATATFTYVDTLADATLITGEYHPANSGGNYVDPLPAPACEIVAAGRDRLWLAGGELAPGEVAPSRLFFPGQTPAFSPALNIQVDRNAEPITAIGFTGDIAAIFRKTSIYVLDADGPDNNYQGAWIPARLAISDSGAVSQEGLAVTSNGLWFQSQAGLRLLSSGGVMVPKAGHDVNPLVFTSVFASAVVVPQFSHIRWYSKDPAQPTVVYNYVDDNWSTWTVSCVNGVFWPTTGLAVLVRSDGNLWVETPGVYNDAGDRYEMRVKTAWLHAGNAGDFQRVRRIALFGQAQAPLDLRVRYFYDERNFHEEEQVVNFPDVGDGSDASQFNTSGWGSASQTLDDGWGLGSWGDVLVNDRFAGAPAGQSTLWFRDKVFRLRRRPARQKCSVFAVEFSDQGVDGPGFVPVILGLELARKTGLDRAAPSQN